MIVDTIWFLMMMWVNTDGSHTYAHWKFETRRQCMTERSIKIDIGDNLVKEKKIKSYTISCEPIEVGKLGKERFPTQPKPQQVPMKSACSGE